MRIDAIQEAQWRRFLELAAIESWRVPERETELFRGAFADCCFALSSHGGVRGFVTAVSHELNGWIGNLLVDEPIGGVAMAARCWTMR